MREQMLFVLAGAAGALAFAVAIRVMAPRSWSRRYAQTLIVAAALYVVFAAWGGSASGIAVEMVGVVSFGGVAVLGLRRRAPGLLALGWAVHAVWDVALHRAGAGVGYTPKGYVAACAGFDLLLAGAIALGWTGAPVRVGDGVARA